MLEVIYRFACALTSNPKGPACNREAQQDRVFQQTYRIGHGIA